METRKAPPYETDGVHAETKTRDPGFEMAGHHCHACYELFYVEAGDCRFLIEDSIHDLRPGDFILLPPMALHYTRYIFGPCRRTVILFRREDIMDEVWQGMPGGDRFFSEPAVFRVPEGYRAQAAGWLKQMTAEELISDRRSALIRQMYLQLLLMLCSRVCSFPAGPPAELHTSDRQILQAARFIGENYMHAVSTPDIARAVGFSPNHLSRKFRQATGIGLHEYLVFIRLNHAAQELAATDNSVTAVALHCGFSDSNYFKDCFKKKYGLTPRQYRRSR